jgi:hypothetical protein
MKPINQYTNAQGVLVTVYPEKKVKRRPWMRGEALFGAKMRIGDENDRCFVQFTRKNGKY